MTIDAVFENGVFRPLQPVQLPEHMRVTVIATEAADADTGVESVHFTLPADRWQAFCDALDAPPKEIPALRRLFEKASPFDGNGPATH
jgi:hypothetical protein